jgi:Amt family ammonium transporter
MKKRLMIAGPVAAIASLVLPGLAFGAETPILDTPEASINAMWVIVAGVLVMFMQAGFLLLEVGFSRAKNAGAGVAKVLVNFSIASLCYWTVGFALAFGGLGEQFIPQPEYSTGLQLGTAPPPVGAPAVASVSPMTTSEI